MVMMWMELECGTSFLAKTPQTRQHFFGGVIRPGVYPTDACVASLFFVFLRITQTNAEFPVGKSGF
jgi:hypothetical protein